MFAVPAGVMGSPSASKAGDDELRSFLRADCTESCWARLSCVDCVGVAADILALSASQPLGVTGPCVPSIAGRGLSQDAVFGLRLGTGCAAVPRRREGVVLVKSGPEPDSIGPPVGWPRMRAERLLSLGVDAFGTFARADVCKGWRGLLVADLAEL